MAYINSYDTLIAISTEQLQKLLDLALEHEITVTVVDGENTHQVREVLCELEYESSDETWNDSGCSYY
jgi:hypothetical protein